MEGDRNAPEKKDDDDSERSENKPDELPEKKDDDDSAPGEHKSDELDDEPRDRNAREKKDNDDSAPREHKGGSRKREKKEDDSAPREFNQDIHAIIERMSHMFEEEILPNIEVEKWPDVRSTCKSLKNLNWDKILKQLGHFKQFLRVDELVFLVNPHPRPISVKSAERPSCFLKGKEPKIIIIDGLCLSEVPENKASSSLHIWNPCLRSHKKLLSNFSPAETTFGIGKVKGEYRILRLSQGKIGSFIQILDLKRNSQWRRKKMVQWKADYHLPGISVDDRMFWVRRSSRLLCTVDSFSFTSESFCTFSKLMFTSEYKVASISSFAGNRLSILVQRCLSDEIALWATGPVSDENIIWSRLFRVSNPILPTLVPNVTAFPAHFVTEDKMAVMILSRADVVDYGEFGWDPSSDEEVENGSQITFYKITDGFIEECPLLKGSAWEPKICAYPYIPSFVQVPDIELPASLDEVKPN